MTRRARTISFPTIGEQDNPIPNVAKGFLVFGMLLDFVKKIVSFYPQKISKPCSPSTESPRFPCVELIYTKEFALTYLLKMFFFSKNIENKIDKM